MRVLQSEVLCHLYLVVAGPPEEGLAALAGEGPEVEAGRGLVADSAQLVDEGVEVLHLQYPSLSVGGMGRGHGGARHECLRCRYCHVLVGK